MENDQQPGWYGTAPGTLRYWDGATYTFTTSPKELRRHAARGTDVPGVDFTAPIHEAPGTDWRGRAGVVVIGVVVVALVAAGVALPLGSALVVGVAVALAGWVTLARMLDMGTPGGAELLGIGVAAGVVIGVLALGTSLIRGPSETTGPDASARMACTHFRNVLGDISDGVLTDEEIRRKAQEVDRDASASEWPGIASASRAFLAAMTSGGDSIGAASRLADVCSTVEDL